MSTVSIGGPPETLLYNDWYPAMRSDLLRGHSMRTAMLMGIPMVRGRREEELSRGKAG